MASLAVAALDRCGFSVVFDGKMWLTANQTKSSSTKEGKYAYIEVKKAGSCEKTNHTHRLDIVSDSNRESSKPS